MAMVYGEQQQGTPMRQPSASSSNIPADYPQAHPTPPFDVHGDNFAAKRMRKVVQRRAVDYTSTVVRYIQMLPTVACADNPSTSFAAKFVHASTNKNRCSINRVLWTPTGRRLITGSQSGEFTLWNGQSFNFEMILQAHDQAIRSMVWSHNENWMVTGDDGGAIKYWQNNMNNVKLNKSAHKESVRDLSFSRTDLKFCSCSDDTTVKVWDFARCQEERSLTGHGWDVKSVDWHPTKSLLVSGGKDNLVKLWDAKSGRELCSFHGHKNTVLCVKWNQNGNWVLTSSKDQIIKLFDIRSMKELESFRGHRKDITALAWHPFHEEYFVSGSFDGSIFHWLVGHETPQVELPGAHEHCVWDLAWHPIGYLLCSGGNDHATRFWCRNRPGDQARDKYNGFHAQGYGDQNPLLAGRAMSGYPLPEAPPTPGAFAAGLSRNEGTIPGIGVAMPLDGSDQEQRPQIPGIPLGGVPPLPPGPHPSLLAAGQQQAYQQAAQQVPQQQQQQLPPFAQQMVPMPLAPPNMNHLQAPAHMPLLPHHLSRPPTPHQMSSLGMPNTMLGSMPMPSSMIPSMPLSMPNPMGSANQMISPLPQAHMMGLNQMQQQITIPNNNLQPGMGGFAGGMTNLQNAPNSVVQNFPMGGLFNRPPAGMINPIQGLGAFQPGMMDVRAPGVGLGGNMGLPPPSQGSGPQ